MRGTFGILIGFIIISVGLAGLGEALHQMMTHAAPDSSMKAAAGLGTFLLAAALMMVLASRA
jgi:divalent metal cation (Fe/Co/Zn/Cd) transporter